MKNKAVDIRDYLFQRKERLFFDANIWFFLFGPQTGTKPEIAIYSDALKRALETQSIIHLDAMVLSEFVNKSFRVRAKIAGGFDIKDFRNSADFAETAREVANDAALVIKNSHVRVNTEFADFNLQQMLDDFQTGGADFNDAIILETCRRNKLKLVTGDGDFVEGGIHILTSHYKLLAACT